MLRFGRSHSAKENGHGPRAQLVIGNEALRKIVNQSFDFGLGQFVTIAFRFNECRNMHGELDESTSWTTQRSPLPLPVHGGTPSSGSRLSKKSNPRARTPVARKILLTKPLYPRRSILFPDHGIHDYAGQKVELVRECGPFRERSDHFHDLP